ncbi:M61 family metallopeptidase, partial [Pseudomonas syringae group genomosp. 7]
YPAGIDARQLQAQASVTLPKGWSFATSLETARRDGDTVVFKPISYDHLVDSPLFAGEHYQRIDLDPGAKVPVHLNVFADEAKSLKPTDAQITMPRALAQQADTRSGARHYTPSEFLRALT